MRSLLVRHVVLPAVLRYRGRPYMKLAARFDREQYQTLQTLRRSQLASFRSLVAHAMEHVPHYADRFRDAGVRVESVRDHDDLSLVPLLTKEDVLANFPDRMTSRRGDTAEWDYVGTRGTTERVMLVHDRAKRDAEWAASFLAMTADSPYDLGKPLVLIPPDECSKLCAVETYKPRGVWEQALAMARSGAFRNASERAKLRGLVMERWLRRVVILPPFGADGTHIGERDLQTYCRQISSRRPTLLKALPEYLVAIARYATRSGFPLPPVPVVKPMGSKLVSALVPEIEAAFRTRVREDYGSQEMGAMAFDCHHRTGLHVLEGCFLVEVTRGGRPVPDGELGHIVVTDLFNRAMPLIRYRIGDVGRLERGPCPCGRTSARLRIEGRREDTLVLGSDAIVTTEVLGKSLYGAPGLDDFQLVERPGSVRFELRYVSSGTVDEPEVSKRARGVLGADETLRLRKVRTLLPEPSGKFRHIVSRSFEAFDDAAVDSERGARSLFLA